MPIKEYHQIQSGAKVKFLRTTIDGQKVSVDVFNDYPLPCRYRFTDKSGRSRVLRFLRDSDIVDQAEQIKLGFLANQPFTVADRKETTFVNGILRTDKLNVQLFLDSIPSNEAFEGDRGDYQSTFKEFKPEMARTSGLAYGKKQAEAVIAMYALTEAEVDIKLFKIFGSQYELPIGEDSLNAKLEALQDCINDSENALEIILEKNSGDTTETLIGKGINAKVLSFIQQNDAVMIKRDGAWEVLQNISSQHTEEQKQSLFRDQLNAPSGAGMRVAITEAIKSKDGIAKIVKVNEEKVDIPIDMEDYLKWKESQKVVTVAEEQKVKADAPLFKDEEKKSKEPVKK